MIREYIIRISDEVMEDEFAGGPKELVRCKDCKYYDGNECMIKYGWFPVQPDWFCADGERSQE